MEEEGIWRLGFIFSGLADWVFFLCVWMKKRRREGLGERKKKWRWPWRERKKKRCWSTTLWVSTGSCGSGLGVLILLVGYGRMEEEGVWSSGFVYSGLADWGERKKKRCWPAAPWVSPAWVSRVRPGCRLLQLFFFFFFDISRFDRV
jgi:hypothetical protein